MRTTEAIAIEHAEYMAKSAERLIEAIYDFHVAIAGEDEDDIDQAGEALSMAQRNLASMIYEFRKRARADE